MPTKKRKPRTVKVCVLECSCGCQAIAVSIGDRRITSNASGGPWRVLMEQAVSQEEISAALAKAESRDD